MQVLFRNDIHFISTMLQGMFFNLQTFRCYICQFTVLSYWSDIKIKCKIYVLKSETMH